MVVEQHCKEKCNIFCGDEGQVLVHKLIYFRRIIAKFKKVVRKAQSFK